MKNVMITILASLTLVSATPVMAASSFSDVPETNWAAPAITFMVDKQIVNGYSDGTFKPEKTVTKAEFVHMYHKLFPNAGGTTTNLPSFVDLKGNWAAKDFIALFGDHAWEFTDHYSSDGKKAYLMPDKQLTRWDVAMLAGILSEEINATVNENGESIVEPDEVLAMLATFKDIKLRPAVGFEFPGMFTPVILTEKYTSGLGYAGDESNMKAVYLYSLIQKDIMTGSADRFRPTDKVTRAEAVTILQRLYTVLENK